MESSTLASGEFDPPGVVRWPWSIPLVDKLVYRVHFVSSLRELKVGFTNKELTSDLSELVSRVRS